MRKVCTTLVVMLLAKSALSAPMTVRTLLSEMTDREALARFPNPPYTTGQASSYDRASKEPGTPQWFANNDWSQFVRSEEHGDRTEWVMADLAGPGCVTRFWSGGPRPRGVIRFYLDGSQKPGIEMPAAELIGGAGLVGPPLSQVTARGLNFYLPIPYATHCKITYDGPNFWQTHREPDQIWYNIEYHTYPPRTQVESFTRVPGDAVERASAALREPFTLTTENRRSLKLSPAGNSTLHLRGPAAVRQLVIRIRPDTPAASLRSTILIITCDGEQTVWCPLAEFFGSGVGLNPMHTWQRRVEKDGAMLCQWIMPFQRACEIEVQNLGARTVSADLSVSTGDWSWDDRSMHFHATWHNQYPIQTRQAAGAMDWNYVTIKGKGVYVGDALTVFNPVPDWWGEGDEKIYVDLEKFPSHFGTGTEDFYGYAYGDPHLFSHPFHAQSRCDGPGNQGFTCITRERSLDAILFSESFKLDLEVWHWKATRMMHSATSFWYARPDAMAEPGPAPDAARSPLSVVGASP